jgi:hypothetical protein
MRNKKLDSYSKAKKKVKNIKGFYSHLTVYILVNLVIVIEGLQGIDFIGANSPDMDIEFLNWMFWNVLSVPILWGIGLCIHGIRIFTPQFRFVKNWEERQLQKFLEEEYKKENSL